MEPHIPSGSRIKYRLLLVTLTLSATCALHAQAPVPGRCTVTAVPTQVRSEGITEKVGDIQLACTGSTPGAVLSGNLVVFLPVSVTNRLDSNANTTHDATLLVDLGGGFVPTALAGLVSGNSISYNGLNITVPASGSFSLRLTNLRGAVFQLGTTNNTPIRATITFQLLLDQSNPIVAYAQTGLFATYQDRGISCTGSPLPGSLTFNNLLAGTAFASTRLTEGYASAFQPRGPGEDNGTRFLIQYSGFPANARLFVPTFVAGSDAVIPTAGGDLGLTPNVGRYLPGSGALLLSLVVNADANGAGGTVVPFTPSNPGAVDLGPVSEIPMSGGAGYAVYEVVAANDAVPEFAQFPTFIAISNVTQNSQAQEQATFAPISTVTTASSSAPILRFTQRIPTSDCTILGDCGANYFPQLSVTTSGLSLTGTAGGAMTGQPGFITIRNSGGGLMNWTATINYTNGSGWLRLETTSGTNVGNIRLFVDPSKLSAGTYNATVTVDGGPGAGVQNVPVTLTVTAPAPPTTTTPSVQVSEVINAATYDVTPLVAGSLGTLKGSNLGGRDVKVTLGGVNAALLYTSDSQINFQAPAALAGKTSADLVVTVDGVSSTPRPVVLSPAWPSLFQTGVLNQDNSINGPGQAAARGSYLQIFATGIPDGAVVSAQIGSRRDLVPAYAGPAPTVTGVQQVNVQIPDDLEGPDTKLILCATIGGQQYCSAGFPLAVQ